ncbi:MAG: dephospho-CoA kinase [Lachnospiraceae bacterium]|nr:dephospho-CoA kinase [Lachnospiraceae bacterium]
MKVIGITGGVGAGKSELLSYLERASKSKVVRADEVGHLVIQPGKVCYMRLLSLLNKNILNPDGTINRKKMAEKVFPNSGLLQSVNQIIHPAVKEYLLDDIAFEKKSGVFDYYFLESALLIEDGYQKICDELWYIYADEKVRRERLKAARDYTDQRIDAVMRSQQNDVMFRRYCAHVIDNSGELKDSYRQIDALLREDRAGKTCQ